MKTPVLLLSLSLRYSDVAFFVLDTRLYRTPFNEDNGKTMLGDRQITALRDWLQQVSIYIYVHPI